MLTPKLDCSQLYGIPKLTLLRNLKITWSLMLQLLLGDFDPHLYSPAAAGVFGTLASSLHSSGTGGHLQRAHMEEISSAGTNKTTLKRKDFRDCVDSHWPYVCKVFSCFSRIHEVLLLYKLSRARDLQLLFFFLFICDRILSNPSISYTETYATWYNHSNRTKIDTTTRCFFGQISGGLAVFLLRGGRTLDARLGQLGSTPSCWMGFSTRNQEFLKNLASLTRKEWEQHSCDICVA